MVYRHPPPNPLEQEPPPLHPRQGGCPLWSGKGRVEVGFYILENAIHWYGVHFIDGRPVPCINRVGRCRPCEDGWIPRRTGFLCAMRGGTGGRYLLRITEYAYRDCPILTLKNVNLRGTGLVISRRGEGRQAPWKIAASTSQPSHELPPSVDTVAVLSLIWGLDLRKVAALPPLDGELFDFRVPPRPERRHNR